MSEHQKENLGHVFDEVPDLYDRVRPGYPPELIADLITLAGLGENGAILEVGCGTGQATRPLAELGYDITAVEPGRGLARLAKQRLADLPTVDIEISTFEEWDPGHRRFDLLVVRR